MHSSLKFRVTARPATKKGEKPIDRLESAHVFSVEAQPVLERIDDCE